VTAVNVTLAWLNLLGDVRELPFLGIYVIMFFDILKTFLRFGIIFFIFIIAFGLGFHLLLVNQTPFEYVRGSLIKTAVMMIGKLKKSQLNRITASKSPKLFLLKKNQKNQKKLVAQ
jgi:transient receptor potential cation channel subfamily A protein 1